MEQREDTGSYESAGNRWLFNPPAASHMGGVWEYQIRTVRRVVFTIMTEQVPTSEMLTTLLVVAEGIINNRPLTPASDDPNDLEPLTPNHLLIHRPASAPPELFNENDLHSRKKWRQVRRILETMNPGVSSDPETAHEMASTSKECPRERLSVSNR